MIVGFEYFAPINFNDFPPVLFKTIAIVQWYANQVVLADGDIQNHFEELAGYSWDGDVLWGI